MDTVPKTFKEPTYWVLISCKSGVKPTLFLGPHYVKIASAIVKLITGLTPIYTLISECSCKMQSLMYIQSAVMQVHTQMQTCKCTKSVIWAFYFYSEQCFKPLGGPTKTSLSFSSKWHLNLWASEESDLPSNRAQLLEDGKYLGRNLWYLSGLAPINVLN